MKVVADGVQEAGGRLLGVSVDFLAATARAGADEMVIARDLAERKALLLAKADAVVIMVGGAGTLDEATEILELKKHGKTEKPVVLLNTAGFYDGLKEQFHRPGVLRRGAGRGAGLPGGCDISGSRRGRGHPVMRAWRPWLHM
jgi:uncharacterized protein (TIGR00730 family)